MADDLLERLLGCPMVRERVEAGQLALHGWHCVIEDGEAQAFDPIQAEWGR